jgi:hypothetical protein
VVVVVKAGVAEFDGVIRKGYQLVPASSDTEKLNVATKVPETPTVIKSTSVMSISLLTELAV